MAINSLVVTQVGVFFHNNFTKIASINNDGAGRESLTPPRDTTANRGVNWIVNQAKQTNIIRSHLIPSHEIH